MIREAVMAPWTKEEKTEGERAPPRITKKENRARLPAEAEGLIFGKTLKIKGLALPGPPLPVPQRGGGKRGDVDKIAWRV